MEANYQHELVGAFGDPIAENPTGIMQEAAFEALGLQWRYLLLHVTAENLEDAVQGARVLGFRGFNCTIPHKVAVMDLLDEIAPDAAKIGAVNTIRRDGDRLIGENTDGKGFLRGLREEMKVDPAGKRILLLGAGGAARAIAVELALAGARELTIYNRSIERGESMVNDLVTRANANATFKSWSETVQVTDDFDILVNATSIGLYPDVSAMPDVNLDTAPESLLVCDVIPNPPITPLIKTARGRGMKTLNGLSMLVFQGVTGFEMWTGQKPPEDVMKKALQDAFGI
jgi:shikimate dehydrogenase